MKYQIFSIVDRFSEIHDDPADGEYENDEAKTKNQQNLLRYDNFLLID